MKTFFIVAFLALASLLSACNLQPTTPNVSEPIEAQANFWQQMGQTVGSSNIGNLAAGNANPVVAYQDDNPLSNTHLMVKQWNNIAGSWNPLGTPVTIYMGYGALSVAFDTTNAAVVAYSSKEPGTSNYRVYVKKWNGTVWEAFGGVSTGLTVNAGHSVTWVSMDMTTTGWPVVAWIEHEVVNSTPGKLFVKRWNGTAWISYETTPTSLNIHTAGAAIGGKLVLDNNNRPNLAWLERETYQNGAYNVYLKRWNGTAWVQNGAGGKINNLDAQLPISLVIDSVNKPVVTWTENDNNVGKVFVKRFDTSWTFLGTNPINTAANKSAFSPRLALNNSGNPLIAWTEMPVGNGLFFRTIIAQQWNGSQWTLMGNTVDTGTTSDLAFDNTNTPLILTTGNDLSVRRFVTGGWQPLASPLDTALVNPANYSSIARTSNNRPIVAWQENVNATDRNVYVKQWTGTGWQNLGLVDRVSTNAARVPSIAVGTDDRPVVAWGETSFDGTNYKNDIFVSRWSSSGWIPLGGRLSSVRNDEWPVVALDSANTPYVTWLSDVNGFRGVYVKKWDGASWVSVNGLPGFSKLNSVSATYTTMIIDKNGNPVVAWAEFEAATSLYTIRVKQWNGIQWGTVRNIGKVTSYDISLAVDSNNTIYVAASQESTLNGKTLSLLRVHYRSAGVNKTLGGYLNQNSNAYAPVIKIGSNNNPVVVWHEIPDSILVSDDLAIKRWNGTAWESIGSEIEDYYFDGSTNPDLVLKTNNNPIISFTTIKSGQSQDIVVKQF